MKYIKHLKAALHYSPCKSTQHVEEEGIDKFPNMSDVAGDFFISISQEGLKVSRSKGQLWAIIKALSSVFCEVVILNFSTFKITLWYQKRGRSWITNYKLDTHKKGKIYGRDVKLWRQSVGTSSTVLYLFLPPAMGLSQSYARSSSLCQ